MSESPQCTAGREAERASRIAARNDAFRTAFVDGQDGVLVLSRALAASSWDFLSRLIDAVRRFDAFPPGDDPHDKHDHGAFTLYDRRYFWKIDVYASPECFDGAHPLDPAAFRILTIMLPEEW